MSEAKEKAAQRALDGLRTWVLHAISVRGHFIDEAGKVVVDETGSVGIAVDSLHEALDVAVGQFVASGKLVAVGLAGNWSELTLTAPSAGEPTDTKANVLDAQLALERAIRRRLATLAAAQVASGSALTAALDEHGEAWVAQAHALRALRIALAADEGVSL